VEEQRDGIESNYQKLQDILSKMGRLLIAFSGGVDSTLLLKVAKDVAGNNVLAVTAVSETSPHFEREEAIKIAKALRSEHLIVESHELDIPEFLKNLEDKCYVCKKHRFGVLIRLAREKGFEFVADGANLDDLSDFRPGIRATRELGVRSPLQEASLSKQQIRLLSKKLKLPSWNKPSYACLASRIPYQSPITIEKLRQVDAGEEFLRRLGLSAQLRVRHYGHTARIELDAEDIPEMATVSLRNQVVNYFRTLGFKFVTVDLEGYRMGSLNRVIMSQKEGK
jgi:uncharacterized protein